MSVEGRVKEVIVDSRINKVLAMRTDSVAMLEALDAISEFYGKDGNTVDARRSLRQDLELQNINLAKKFLIEFGEVHDRINSVELQARNLENSCQVLSSRVSNADANMKSFMDKASELESRRSFYLQQSDEIGAFLTRFQLTSEEIEILYQAPIEQPAKARAFFEALQRLRESYTDCKSMVERHKYSAGFELLEALGQHQNMAYQRLFEWVKTKCDTLTETGSTEDIDVKLQIAVRFLKDLPVYYSQCQDLVIASRRTQLVQRFVVALTQGGPFGQVFRAIDMHAHDSVRYVGDMLAWMHQAIASESEFLDAVFGDEIKRNKSTKSPKTNSHNATNTNINSVDKSSNQERNVDILNLSDLLARCLQGLGRPLRVRIMQTLEARTSLEVLYPLTDLLSFYEQTLSDIIQVENAVHSAIKGCLLECKRLFISSLNKQAEALVQSPSTYPLDLTTSHSTKECAKQIQEILKVHATALSRVTTEPTDECYIDNVLGCIIQPLLQSCRVGGQALKGSDMSIFMLNNVAVIKHELQDAAQRSDAGHKATASWLGQLGAETEIWVDVLVREETSRTLHRSDLDKIYDLVDIVSMGSEAIYEANEPASGLGQERVSAVLRAFYSSLFSPVAPQFERLQDPETREITRRLSAEAVADAYEKIYNFILRANKHYDSSILAHNVDEVRVLLGCSD